MENKYISKRYWNKVANEMAQSSDSVDLYDDLINFSIGDFDINTDYRIIKAAFEDALDGHTHYTEPAGMIELRQEICKFYKEEYGYDVNPAELMITTSASHGMYLTMEAILDDGDEVLIPIPSFSPYSQQVKLARGKPVFVETYEDEEFQIKADRLEEAVTDRTKAIIINTPNNPTGACLSRETMEEVARIAEKYDLLIIADDIYTIYSYQEAFLPITTLDNMRKRTITLGSFSKDYVMTGWRIGYILAEAYFIDVIKDINEAVVYTAPSISQRAAIHALRLRDEIQPDLVEKFKERIFYAYERLKGLKNVSILEPKGTFYLFPNIKATGLTSAELTAKILEEAHVLVIPGTAFGTNGEGYLRLACTLDIDKMKEAFDRMEQMEIFK